MNLFGYEPSQNILPYDGESVSLVLENGSLLVMKGTTQTYWQHSLPKSKKIAAPRINLTFRTMVYGPLPRMIGSMAH
jgi:hypothetical protein